MVVWPIGGRGNTLLVGELQSLNTTDNFVHVASDASRVVQRKHQLVLGVDDENRTEQTERHDTGEIAECVVYETTQQ